jgi:hypothetical protein
LVAGGAALQAAAAIGPITLPVVGALRSWQLVFLLVGLPGSALALYGLNFFLASVGIGPGNAALQVVTPNQMRGQAIRYSLTTAAAITGPIAVLITWWGMKPYARSVARAAAWN